MGVTLTGSQSLFVREGALLGEVARVCSAFGDPFTGSVQNIHSKYTSTDIGAPEGIVAARDTFRTAPGGYLNTLYDIMSKTVISMADRDVTLATKTALAAWAEVAKQMRSSGDTIARPTVGVTVTVASGNKGDAQLVASTVNEFGDQLDMVSAESVVATVTTDAAGGATKYQEAVSYVGQPAKDRAAYDWPGGSGCNGSFNATDAAVATLLTDSSFENWTGAGNNTPVSWAVLTGTAGTQVLQSASPLRGSYALRISSDGSTLTKIRQAVSLKPNKVYALGLWAKMSALDASGVVRFRLTDDAGTPATLTNDAGGNLTYNRDTNGQIGTSFGFVGTFFQTPRQLPTTVYLEFGLTTSPASGKTLDLDLAALVEAKPLYTGGPFVACFSKSTALAKGDYFTLAVTNSLGAASFARGLDRVFSFRANGLYLPSDPSSPTVSDALIATS